jgi:hypothetical protein
MKAIVQMSEGSQDDKNNFNSVYGALFFGVPNQGIRIEQWLPIVEGQPNESLIRDLSPESAYLRALQDSFRSTFAFPDSQIISIYETEKTKVAKVKGPFISYFLP